MNIILFGGTGFIGTNLVIELAKNKENHITIIDQSALYYKHIEALGLSNVCFKSLSFALDSDFESVLQNQDVLYHLISTTVPTTSNQHISQEISANVMATTKLLEAAVACKVKKVVFISSGGTVYGKEFACPLSEQTPTNPITTYGLQKLTIEKLLYLFQYMYGLDYRIIRLANPYGPYQRPNGVLGAVTTFTYKAIKNETITVYGDGSVVRDFIYIDDAIRGILNIVNGESKHRLYNLGSGNGISILQVLNEIEKELGLKLNIEFLPGRTVDVPTNYLDISRYERCFGILNPISLSEGIRKTAHFLSREEVL